MVIFILPQAEIVELYDYFMSKGKKGLMRHFQSLQIFTYPKLSVVNGSALLIFGKAILDE